MRWAVIQHFVRLPDKTIRPTTHHLLASGNQTPPRPAFNFHLYHCGLFLLVGEAGGWMFPLVPGPVNESYKLSQQHQLTGSSFSPQTSPKLSCNVRIPTVFCSVRRAELALILFSSRNNSVSWLRLLAPSAQAWWEEDGCERSWRVYHINYRGPNINRHHGPLNQGEWGKDKSSQNNNCKYISVASLVSTGCS